MEQVTETALRTTILSQSIEIEKLRKLTLQLILDKDKTTDSVVAFTNTEASFQQAYNEVCEELSRKQAYLQTSFDTIAVLRTEIAELRETQAHGSSGNEDYVQALKRSLQEAWEELERKQSYLEAAVSELEAANLGLQQARQEINRLSTRGNAF